MKLKSRQLLSSLALLGVMLCASSNAVALTLNSTGVVGIWDDRSNASPETRAAAAQNLLNLPANTGTFGFDTYVTSSTEYAGTISGLGLKIDGPIGGWGSVSGYDYGFIKYDGPNAGYVLFYLGGAVASSLIPDYPAPLWTTQADQYGVSGITFYNSRGVPDGGSTIALLGLGLALLAIARRKLA